MRKLVQFAYDQSLDGILTAEQLSTVGKHESYSLLDAILVREQHGSRCLEVSYDGLRVKGCVTYKDLLAEQRFINAHGQPFARLDNTDSIYPKADGHKITWVFRVVNLVLLHAPSSFLKDLHSVSVDDIILEYAWRCYFKRLLDDWDRLVLQVHTRSIFFEHESETLPGNCRLDRQRVFPRDPRCYSLSRPT